jgi:hypothetical protein
VSWSYTENAQDGTFIVYDNANSIATLTANGNGNSGISQSHYVTASLVPVSYPSSGSVTMSLFVNGAATIATTAYTNTTITASFLVGTGSIYNITGSIQWNPPPIAPVSWSYSESAQDGTFIVYDNASTIATLTANGTGNAEVFTSNYVTASLVPVNYPSSGSVTMSLNINGSTTASVTSNANTTITASFLVTTGSAYSITGSIQWNPTPLTIDYLVVGGGGAGGGYVGGGGGGGEFQSGSNSILQAATTYSVVVGNGGTEAAFAGTNGQTSSFNSIVSIGGGYGGAVSDTPAIKNGNSGSSGGGGTYYANATGGTGLAGNNGGNGSDGAGTANYSGGGGGAAAAGANGSSTSNGGAGKAWVDGNYYCGGGGGYRQQATLSSNGTGGIGGGGDGYQETSPTGAKLRAVTSGSINTGGGGGGGASGSTDSGDWNGGSGIVKIRYAGSGSQATGGTIAYSGSYTYHTFTASGNFITN